MNNPLDLTMSEFIVLALFAILFLIGLYRALKANKKKPKVKPPKSLPFVYIKLEDYSRLELLIESLYDARSFHPANSKKRRDYTELLIELKDSVITNVIN